MAVWYGHPSQYPGGGGAGGGAGGGGGVGTFNVPTSITGSNGIRVSSTSYTFGHQLELNLQQNSDFTKLQERIEELEKRLLVLHPDGKLHEKYESLKEAYESYLIIEKLVNEKPRI